MDDLAEKKSIFNKVTATAISAKIEDKTKPKASDPFFQPVKNFKWSFNRVLKDKLKMSIGQVYDEEKLRFERKFGILDHTAEVLENFRRFEEHKIFREIEHKERMKSIALDKERIKLPNIIWNYELKFGENSSLENEPWFYQLEDFIEVEQIE